MPVGLVYEPGCEVEEMVGSIGSRHVLSTLRQDKQQSLNLYQKNLIFMCASAL
jgi:hypothetical protein